MKFSLGVAAALAGFASAAEFQPADVYIMSQSPESTPELGRAVAQLIFMQRLASVEDAGSLRDYPEDALEYAIESLNTYGKQPQALFQDATQQPSQLLIMIEGVTGDNQEAIQQALADIKPAFQVKDTPKSAAHHNLVKHLASAGAAQTECSLDRAVNPFNAECWSGKSSVALYDLNKDPKMAQILADNVSRLVKLASTGEMDTILVLIPESTRDAHFKSWDLLSHLTPRQVVEEVMTEADEAASTPSTSPNNGQFVISAKDSTIPACFSSQSSCETATGNCTSHGSCVNKYPKAGEGKECFHCKCLRHKQGWYWAGSSCSKKDVSVPFWLFAGLTVTLIGVVSFSISLLYSIGDQPLPGVIGAGVSTSSK